MSFVGISMMSFCQHLCIFGFIYIPTKHWVRAQTSFCKARAWNSPVFSWSLGSATESSAVTKCCSNPGLAVGCSNALLFLLAGGLLICLPREQAARFCAEIKSPKYGEGHQAWIIGIVEKGNRTARIIDKPRIIEVAPQVATQNVNPTPGATS